MESQSCGFSLRNNVIVLAIIQLVSEMIGIALKVVLIVSVIKEKQGNTNLAVNIHGSAEPSINLNERQLSSQAEVSIATYSLQIAVHTGLMILAIFLLLGAIQESSSKCKIWVNVTAAALVLSLLMMLVNALLGHITATSETVIIPFVFSMFMKLYIMWVVLAFTRYLQYKPMEETVAEPEADVVADGDRRQTSI